MMPWVTYHIIGRACSIHGRAHRRFFGDVIIRHRRMPAALEAATTIMTVDRPRRYHGWHRRGIAPRRAAGRRAS